MDVRVGLWRKLSTEELFLWTAVLEKTLARPLDCQEIQPVHAKGDQFWVFIGRTDVEAETPVLWPPDVKSWLTWKDRDAGKDWGQKEKGMTEDEMVGWHHRLDGHGFGWTPGVGDGQGGLACCGSWGHKESDTTERLTWTEESLMTWESVHALIWSDVTPCTQFDYWKIYVEILRENILQALHFDNPLEKVPLHFWLQYAFSSSSIYIHFDLQWSVENTVLTTRSSYPCFNFQGEKWYSNTITFTDFPNPNPWLGETLSPRKYANEEERKKKLSCRF